MTDMTSDTTVTPALRNRRAASRLEYRIYFALIVAVALPGTVVGWVRDALTGCETAKKGPIARALSHASTITPQIFRP